MLVIALICVWYLGFLATGCALRSSLGDDAEAVGAMAATAGAIAFLLGYYVK